jgi:ABC-type sulfate/molybdate transport systems ATPase subunit
VSIALELRGVTKGFTAGAGVCTASAQVLRGIDLTVHAGESLALVGQAGSGKSTLLLCAAGLLRPDAGYAKWFGDSDRATAARRVVYHCTAHGLTGTARATDATLHLVDMSNAADAASRLVRWVDRRSADGDAVIVSTRDEDLARHLAARIVVLSGGRVHVDSRARSRVAERASPSAHAAESRSECVFVDHSNGHV